MPYPFCDPREHSSNLQLTYEGYIDKMATFASSLIAGSYKVELFGSDVGADPSAIEDMRTTLASCHQVPTPEYEPIDSVRDLLIRIAAMDYVVTCRFHGVVFAHILNKPVLAIAHHAKVANLMGALGLSEYCVDIETFDPIRLTDTFQSLVSNAEQVKRVMATSLEIYRSRLASQYDTLFSPTSGHVSMPEATTPRTSEMGSRQVVCATSKARQVPPASS
jgi:polysaccharide pyruvyl transferase WcaK-like protein